jgi:hypothetical protein
MTDYRMQNRRHRDRRQNNPIIRDLCINAACTAIVGVAWGHNAMLWSLLGGLLVALANQRVWNSWRL